jgi:serine/threonine protein kinase/Tfp pilus assembly protein PilF
MPAVTNVGLSISQMALMSQLLDEALALDEAGRRRWLEQLSPEHQDLAEPLRRALLPDAEQAGTLAAVSAMPNLGARSNLKPGGRVGPYELIRSLGAGGMAEVWLARRADGAFKREVALKLPMLTNLRGDLKPRFAHERDILASLEHPHIARFYDAGIEPDGLPYLAMEFVQGKPLTDWCEARNGGISERLGLFLQVLEAVQYAHEKQVIHRDLKPSNILVTESSQVRLLDFGVAKLLEEESAERTPLTSIYGRALTPDYASPELLRGDPLDARSDIYSLGVLLYQLLTGDRPYRLKNAAAVGLLDQAIARIQVNAPSTQLAHAGSGIAGTELNRFARRLRGDLDAIVLKALARDPALRYQSAAAFAQDLKRYLEGKPVQARQAQFQYRLQKFVGRNTALFAVSAAALMVAIVSIGYWLYRGSHSAIVIPGASSVPVSTPRASTPDSAMGTPKAATDSGALAPPAHSLAVLPFIDMSEAKNQEYFSDGLAEELLDLLTKIPGLHVIARTSSFSFKGKSDDIPTIAKKLNVANILEGSVRKSGDRLRVTAQLIDASTGENIWSDSYERKLQDVFILQDEIAGALVRSLKLKLAPGEEVPIARSTSSIEAHNQYLLGRHFDGLVSTDGTRRAVLAYRKATELDPQFAAAYAALSTAEFWQGTQSGNANGNRAAMAAAEKAIALAPDQADGYTARALVRSTANWDWTGAQADLEQARKLNPGDGAVERYYGFILAALGRLPEAIAVQRKDVELEPLASEAWDALGESLMATGEFAAAHEALARALEINAGSDFWLPDLAELQLVEGNASQALSTAEKITEPSWRNYIVAAAEHTLNHDRESDHALQELIAKYSHLATFQIAEVYGWRGEKDHAIEWLERAYSQHDAGVVDIKFSPMLSSLHGEPRFETILRKMRLPL